MPTIYLARSHSAADLLGGSGIIQRRSSCKSSVRVNFLTCRHSIASPRATPGLVCSFGGLMHKPIANCISSGARVRARVGMGGGKEKASWSKRLTAIAAIFAIQTVCSVELVRCPLYAFMRLCLRFFALVVCGAGSLIWMRAPSTFDPLSPIGWACLHVGLGS